MDQNQALYRFVAAQERDYSIALAELRAGRKRSHWMWYIFPQIAGLGHSVTARFYSLQDIAEARAFLEHPLLGRRITELSRVLLSLPTNNANEVFGSPDDRKLRSCMTLFAMLNKDPVFEAVLDKYFNGARDERTIGIVGG